MHTPNNVITQTDKFPILLVDSRWHKTPGLLAFFFPFGIFAVATAYAVLVDLVWVFEQADGLPHAAARELANSGLGFLILKFSLFHFILAYAVFICSVLIAAILERMMSGEIGIGAIVAAAARAHLAQAVGYVISIFAIVFEWLAVVARIRAEDMLVLSWHSLGLTGGGLGLIYTTTQGPLIFLSAAIFIYTMKYHLKASTPISIALPLISLAIPQLILWIIAFRAFH